MQLSKFFSLLGLSLIISIVMFPQTGNAHGAGMTFSEVVDGYQVDVDYSDLVLESGTAGRFTFNLFSDPEREEPVEFTDLWVRIEKKREGKNGEILFAGPIFSPTFGGPGFTIVFPKGGEYELSVRYNNGDKEVVEATFPLSVEKGAGEKNFFDIGFWRGLFCGVLAVLLFGGVLMFAQRRGLGKVE
jgi:hypothetical protein